MTVISEGKKKKHHTQTRTHELVVIYILYSYIPAQLEEQEDDQTALEKKNQTGEQHRRNNN